MTRQATLAKTIRFSATPIERALTGFKNEDRARQAPGMPNHAVWILGHCALTLHRAAERIDGQPLPDLDFVTGDGKCGTADRFDTESICFGSVPLPEPRQYPTLARASAIFASAIERLARAVTIASDETLDQTTTWGTAGTKVKLGELVQRVSIHNGIHAGQLMDLRRALGLPSIFA